MSPRRVQCIEQRAIKKENIIKNLYLSVRCGAPPAEALRGVDVVWFNTDGTTPRF